MPPSRGESDRRATQAMIRIEARVVKEVSCSPLRGIQRCEETAPKCPMRERHLLSRDTYSTASVKAHIMGQLPRQILCHSSLTLVERRKVFRCVSLSVFIIWGTMKHDYGYRNHQRSTYLPILHSERRYHDRQRKRINKFLGAAPLGRSSPFFANNLFWPSGRTEHEELLQVWRLRF
jgi:hypothetical protein